ncbi:MAG: PilZ domain-containing protein [Vulcanimicrobiaceae bacterium]
MSWISSSPLASVKNEQKEQKEPESAASAIVLEHETLVNSRNITGVSAVVEHITSSQCRLRTTALFVRNDIVEFEFGISGRPQARAIGRVISRVPVGRRFSYIVMLDQMSAAQTDALARSISDVYRRYALSRSLERHVANLPTTDRVRSDVRVVSQIPVQYRVEKGDLLPGKAGDISSGGLSLVCGSNLLEGMFVELRFTLPSDILKVFPEETLAFDPQKATAKGSGRADLRRPFELMVIRARVVSRTAVGSGVRSYGLAFYGIDGFMREEIARYVHAVQLGKRRK